MENRETRSRMRGLRGGLWMRVLRHLRRAGLVVPMLLLLLGGLAVLAPPSFAAAPTISSFSPTAGRIGTNVTINGSGFTGATSVRFNDAPGKFTVKSGTKITATVPPTASTGPISVTTPGGTGKSSTSFNVNPG